MGPAPRGGRRSASPPPVGCEPTPHGRWPVWRRRRRSTPYTTVVPPDTWEAGPSQRTPAAPTRAHAVVGRVSRIRGTLAGGGGSGGRRWPWRGGKKDRVWLGDGGGRGAAGGRRPARPTRGCRGGRPRRGRVCWERSGCAPAAAATARQAAQAGPPLAARARGASARAAARRAAGGGRPPLPPRHRNSRGRGPLAHASAPWPPHARRFRGTCIGSLAKISSRWQCRVGANGSGRRGTGHVDSTLIQGENS